jgi:hypothetical protein
MAALTQIRMLTKGPNKNLPKARVIAVDPLRAASLIAGKHAQAVEEQGGDDGTR